MIDEQTFPPGTASVPAVRRFVLDAVDDLPGDELDRVQLLVSELATNAVLYGGTAFVVRVDCADDRLVVAVTDKGGGSPEVQAPPPTEPHGRGLLIVSQLADDWGIETSRDGRATTVWFLLRLGRALARSSYARTQVSERPTS